MQQQARLERFVTLNDFFADFNVGRLIVEWQFDDRSEFAELMMGFQCLFPVVGVDLLGETPMFGSHFRILFGGSRFGGGHLERLLLLLEHRNSFFCLYDLHVYLGDLLKQFVLGGTQFV